MNDLFHIKILNTVFRSIGHTGMWCAGCLKMVKDNKEEFNTKLCESGQRIQETERNIWQGYMAWTTEEKKALVLIPDQKRDDAVDRLLLPEHGCDLVTVSVSRKRWKMIYGCITGCSTQRDHRTLRHDIQKMPSLEIPGKEDLEVLEDIFDHEDDES